MSAIQNPKIWFIVAIPVILLIALISVTGTPKTPDVMNLEVETLTGPMQTIGNPAFKDKTLIVEFFTTWCYGCQEITNNLKTVLANSSIDTSNLVILSVSVDPNHDTNTRLQSFINNNSLTPYTDIGQWIFGRDLSEQYTFYSVSGIPHTFLVQANTLKIVESHLGILEVSDIYAWLS